LSPLKRLPRAGFGELPPRGQSAERRTDGSTSALSGFGGRAHIAMSARLSAPHRGDFGLRDRASGEGQQPLGPPDPAGFRPRSSAPVQPLKAAPRSEGGRLPAASRRCACEAHPRAPPSPLRQPERLRRRPR
jgi:hypothetical protein